MNFYWHIQSRHKSLLIIGVFSTSLFFLSGCGRKQRNIFTFAQKQEEVSSIKPLYLPSIHGLRAERGADKILLKWEPIGRFVYKFITKISEDGCKYGEKEWAECVGYDVYKFDQDSFIPRKPINKKPLQEPVFIDSDLTEQKRCYVVRGLFRVKDMLSHGPASRVICC